MISLISTSFAQENETATDEQNTSENHLKSLYKLEDFYLAQLKKGTLSEPLRDKYKINMTNTQNEITFIKNARLDHAKSVSLTEPALLEQEKFNFQFREMDVALAKNESPDIFAYEIKSLILNVGVSFLSTNKYSVPFSVSAEKSLTEQFSVGAYAGHFIETIDNKLTYPDSNEYLHAYKENYKHNYFNVGLKGSYHFFNPEFILDIEKFDLYATAMIGYTISSSTFPFLNNQPDLPYDKDGNEVTADQNLGEYLKPNKAGINFGAYGGLRYMYDANVGFFLEAGYGNTAFATCGITIRLLDKNTINNAENSETIEFKVKIIESEKKKKLTSKSFKGEVNIEEYQVKKMYYYLIVGKNTSYGAATLLCAQVKESKKFKKAEVVAIKNGEKFISLKKAMKALEGNLVKTVTIPGN